MSERWSEPLVMDREGCELVGRALLFAAGETSIESFEETDREFMADLGTDLLARSEPSVDCEDICMDECQGPCGVFS